MNINDIISSGLLELYATGLASPEEKMQVEQWIQQYPEVADELQQIETAMGLYAQANGMQPDVSVKEKIFERINETGNQQTAVADSTRSAKVVKMSSAWKNVAAAAVLLLIASGVINYIQYNKNTEISEQLQQSREVAGILEQRNKEMDDYLEKVRSTYSTPVSLASVKTDNASAKVFWMKNTGDVFVDPSNLPAPEKGKQYELWAIIEGNPAPVNAGIIITTKEGNTYTIQKMKNFGNAKVQAFAVSVEKESKVPAVKPTEVYVMGKM